MRISSLIIITLLYLATHVQSEDNEPKSIFEGGEVKAGRTSEKLRILESDQKEDKLALLRKLCAKLRNANNEDNRFISTRIKNIFDEIHVEDQHGKIITKPFAISESEILELLGQPKAIYTHKDVKNFNHYRRIRFKMGKSHLEELKPFEISKYKVFEYNTADTESRDIRLWVVFYDKMVVGGKRFGIQKP